MTAGWGQKRTGGHHAPLGGMTWCPAWLLRSRLSANSCIGTPHPNAGHLRRVDPEGELLEVTELDLDRLQEAWQEAVFAL